jgi:DNA-binding beta-propeller fold protein YncE
MPTACSRNVSQIDPEIGKVRKTFTVGQSPVGLAFDGSHIWVANGSSIWYQKLSKVKTSGSNPTP